MTSNYIGRLVLTLLLASGFSHEALAQTVTAADIQRVQDNLADVSRDLPQVKSNDPSLAARLRKDVEEASDEAIYLKVKLRKAEPVTRNEYLELVDQVDRLRDQVRFEVSGRTTPSGSAAPSAGVSGTHDVPVGTEIDVRIQQALNSGTAQVEDRFEATTMVDLRQGERILVPAGSTLRGIVSSVNKAGRIERKGSMTVAFDRITVKGRDYPIRATVTEAIESEGIKGDAAKIGVGAGVGAIIGGILGGAKGAIAGILIGGGGTIAATEGKDVDLPSGTVLRVRLDSGLNLR